MWGNIISIIATGSLLIPFYPSARHSDFGPQLPLSLDWGSASNAFDLFLDHWPKELALAQRTGTAGLIRDVSKPFLGGHCREEP
jgi:hypothetical protein